MAKAKPLPRRVRVFPLPEALPEHRQARGGRWEIDPASGLRGDHGSTNVEQAKMRVPLDDDPNAECVRAHEMAHARWSPAKVPDDLAHDVVQHVEDARMHLLLKRVGVDMSAGVLAPGERKDAAARLTAAGAVDGRTLTLALLAMTDTGDREHFARLLITERAQADALGRVADVAKINDAFSLAAQAERMLRGDGTAPKFARTRVVAEWLQRMLASREEAEREARKAAEEARRKGADDGSDAKGGAGKARPKATAKDVEDSDKAMRAYVGGSKLPGGAGEGDGANWGDMRIETPVLALGLPRRVLSAHKRGRPEESGIVPKHWSRWCSDKRVFDAPKRMRRGTVLVDFSSSMSLDPANVAAILESAPAATVACYSGTGAKGVLRILARKGRRVANALVAPPCGGGNVIDGPALRWLAKQDGPRLWVSDGGVTGCGDAQHTGELVDAARICRLGGIARVSDVRLVPDVLAQRSSGA